MKRALQQALQEWKNSPHRLPLLIRGARQVGKTYVVEAFGKSHFEQVCTLNFEQRPELKRCFETLLPQDILRSAEILCNTTIEPGKTLLFLDEIQECPQAILALRYFKEQLPQLHVIGAGSLLEFALHSKNFRMPVGRVEFMYLTPLSFKEYLIAKNADSAVEAIETADFKHPLPAAIHTHLLKTAQEYAVLGGMPAVVNTFIQTQNWQACQNLQTTLLTGYRFDFGKYAKHTQHKYLELCFERAVKLVGQVVKYSHIDPEVRSRELKEALQQLTMAGLLQPIVATAASGLPLNAQQNEKKFKLLFLDIGLLQRVTALEAEILLQPDLLLVGRGGLAEQWVGQALLASSPPAEPPALYFWHREQAGSQAEVDFVVQIDEAIIPIEVKAGTTGTLRSLHRFLHEKKTAIGIRISQKPLRQEGNILHIPLYLASELKRLVRSVCQST